MNDFFTRRRVRDAFPVPTYLHMSTNASDAQRNDRSLFVVLVLLVRGVRPTPRLVIVFRVLFVLGALKLLEQIFQRTRLPDRARTHSTLQRADANTAAII